jgi:hypothetical protein
MEIIEIYKIINDFDWDMLFCTIITQQLHNNADVSNIFIFNMEIIEIYKIINDFDWDMLFAQLLHNNCTTMLMCLVFSFLKKRKMLDLQHQHNNCTTTPHMKVGPTHWGPPSCEGLLCTCCDGIV